MRSGELAGLISYTRGAPTASILGREIEVITANGAKAEARLRGLTCAGMYIDEATLIPEDFWTQALARLSVPGSKLFATTNPGAPSHWLRKKYLLRAGETGLRTGTSPSTTTRRSIRPTCRSSSRRTSACGTGGSSSATGVSLRARLRHVGRVQARRRYPPPISDWLCLAVDHGTTNPLHALLIGLGVNDTLYVVAEWRYDSRAEGRQLTDIEYSGRLRDWL